MATPPAPADNVIITLPQYGVDHIVNKALLQSSSPFFKAAFSGCWKESNKNRIELFDCKPETVKTFIRWLSTGELYFHDEGPLDEHTDFDDESTTLSDNGSTTSYEDDSTTLIDNDLTVNDDVDIAASNNVDCTDSKDVDLGHDTTSNSDDGQTTVSPAANHFKGHIYAHPRQIIDLYIFTQKYDVRILGNTIVMHFEKHCAQFCLLHDSETAVVLIDYFFATVSPDFKLFKMFLAEIAWLVTHGCKQASCAKKTSLDSMDVLSILSEFFTSKDFIKAAAKSPIPVYPNPCKYHDHRVGDDVSACDTVLMDYGFTETTNDATVSNAW